MRFVLTAVAVLTFCSFGCGNEIGDACSISPDCSPNGDRTCDTSSTNGYCTIIGCNFDTCPEEAVCVRFFSVGDTGVECANNDECSADELCTLGGFCVPRSAEVRFCMRKCGGNDDCRDAYECRDEELMKLHGGEPVAPPGETPDNLESFCAEAPPV
jgi:hypothetical protein